MARTEARLLTSIWDDDEFVDSEPLEQRMFMFLLSQSDLAHDGVISIREPRWAKRARGLTVADVQKAIAGLAEKAFVVVDEEEGELLIRSFLRRDKVFKQPNVLHAAADHLAHVKSHVIRVALALEIIRILAEEEMVAKSRDILTEMLESLPITVSTSSVRPTGNPTDNPSEEPNELPSGKGTELHPGERGGVKAVGTRTETFPELRSSDSESSDSETAAPSNAQERAKRGTRIPPDFEMTEAMANWGREHAPQVNGPRETLKFINYWTAKPGKDGVKLDWLKTWQNWILTAAERAGGARSGSPPAGQKVDWNAAMARAQAREESK